MNAKEKPDTLFLVSRVDFCDGKRDVLVITGVSPGTADKAHHAHKREVSEFWDGFKRAISGQYQAFADFFDALEACERWKD